MPPVPPPPPDMRRDVQEIFRLTPHEKQCMMFSATLSKDIRPVCRKFMQDVSTPRPRCSSVALPGPEAEPLLRNVTMLPSRHSDAGGLWSPASLLAVSDRELSLVHA